MTAQKEVSGWGMFLLRDTNLWNAGIIQKKTVALAKVANVGGL